MPRNGKPLQPDAGREERLARSLLSPHGAGTDVRRIYVIREPLEKKVNSAPRDGAQLAWFRFHRSTTDDRPRD